MRRVFPLLLIIFIIASVAIYLFGDSGVVALHSLEAYQRSLAANVDALKQRNTELSAELERLQSGREDNHVLARGVGMYAADEVVVKLEGQRSRPVTYAMGDLIRMKKAKGGSTVTLKAVAVALTILLTAFALLAARTPRRRANGGHGR